MRANALDERNAKNILFFVSVTVFIRCLLDSALALTHTHTFVRFILFICGVYIYFHILDNLVSFIINEKLSAINRLCKFNK